MPLYMWALSVLQQAPSLSSQAVILIKVRLTSSLDNVSSNNTVHIPANKSETSKTIFPTSECALSWKKCSFGA